MKVLILFAALLPALANAADTPNQAKCQYFNVKTEAFVTAPCLITWKADGALIQIGQRRFVVVETGRQGQWSFVTINGKPGARYEIDRETFSYATTDLNEFLDISH
jgi:hypothetical protein